MSVTPFRNPVTISLRHGFCAKLQVFGGRTPVKLDDYQPPWMAGEVGSNVHVLRPSVPGYVPEPLLRLALPVNDNLPIMH